MVHIPSTDKLPIKLPIVGKAYYIYYSNRLDDIDFIGIVINKHILSTGIFGIGIKGFVIRDDSPTKRQFGMTVYVKFDWDNILDEVELTQGQRQLYKMYKG